jgi:dodecin
MPVARVTEMSATSDQSLEDAINQAVSRATNTLRNVEGAWVKDMNVEIQNNRISAYKVNVAITFVLEEGEQPARRFFEKAHRSTTYGSHGGSTRSCTTCFC